MSEFKFACPVCGQHVKCESDKTGTAMECPTCFQKIIVPQAPATEESKYVLTASQPQSRPVPQVPALSAKSKDDSLPARKFLIAVVVVLLVAGSAGAVIYFWQGINRPPPSDQTLVEPDLPVVKAPPPPPINDTNWMMDITNAVVPDRPAGGRIYGKDFVYDNATLQGGVLHLAQGTNSPPDLSAMVRLFARRGEDLAGKSITVTTNRPPPVPRVVLRWKDDQQNPVVLGFDDNYALQLDFGQVNSNHISGTIYVCLPDDGHSYVAGRFTAEIRKPMPSKPRPVVRPKKRR